MKNDFLKYFKSSSLITVIVILTIALYMAKCNYGISLAISGTVTLFLVLISKYLWKYKPFKWLFWIDDFSGRYEGTLEYSYVDEDGMLQKGQRKHIKIISQSGSHISIASFTVLANGELSSPSTSKGMFVELTDDGSHYKIIYSYLNEGNHQLGFPPHYGTDVIKFIKKDYSKELSGYYYTNRNPQTRGAYVGLKWVSNSIKHEF